jgi:uncharacterized protein (TIGR02118 family)
MVSYFVRYRGQAADAAAFTEYYAGTHAGVLRRFPGIRALTLHTAAASYDPFPVRSGGTLLLAQMTFDSPEALDTALRSPARQEAREDFALFPKFDGEITHEAMTRRVIFE